MVPSCAFVHELTLPKLSFSAVRSFALRCFRTGIRILLGSD